MDRRREERNGGDMSQLTSGARRDSVEAYQRIAEAQAKLFARDAEIQELTKLRLAIEATTAAVKQVKLPATARIP
jgi:hypothetical protein